MSGNSFGKNFVVTSFGESHGAAIGCIIDGCPPQVKLAENDIQKDFDEAINGIKRLPRSSCLGVYLAYRYYNKLLKKLKLTPASKLLNKRIRVNNFQKFMLLPSALLFSLFMRRA